MSFELTEQEKAMPPDVAAEITELESKFANVMDIVKPITPTGEAVVTLSLGGEVAENDPCGLYGNSPSAAWKAMLDALRDYLRPFFLVADKYTIYWRERPNIYAKQLFEDATFNCRVGRSESGVPVNAGIHLASRLFYAVWARLLVSDKPILSDEQLGEQVARRHIENS